MERPFTEVEVFQAIELCAVDKALCQDGFTKGFFKPCWGTLTEDLMQTLQNFHHIEIFEKKFNATCHSINT